MRKSVVQSLFLCRGTCKYKQNGTGGQWGDREYQNTLLPKPKSKSRLFFSFVYRVRSDEKEKMPSFSPPLSVSTRGTASSSSYKLQASHKHMHAHIHSSSSPCRDEALAHTHTHTPSVVVASSSLDGLLESCCFLCIEQVCTRWSSTNVQAYTCKCLRNGTGRASTHWSLFSLKSASHIHQLVGQVQLPAVKVALQATENLHGIIRKCPS